MQEFHINYLALLIATIAKMLVGMVWYSSPVFGKLWMTLVGCTPEQMKATMPKALLVDFISSYVMAFVLVHAVHYAGAISLPQGAVVGFFNWLGFIAAATLVSTVYEKRPVKLFLINNGYQLISLLIMGAIVAVWT
jgi:hypothetical protein